MAFLEAIIIGIVEGICTFFLPIFGVACCASIPLTILMLPFLPFIIILQLLFPADPIIPDSGKENLANDKNETKLCDVDSVEIFLSNLINSSQISINENDSNTSIRNTTQLSIQDKALLWLKGQNMTQIDQCDHYSILQKYVLAILYYSTNGVNWVQQGNFMSNKSVCYWKGVFCNEGEPIATQLIIGE